MRGSAALVLAFAMPACAHTGPLLLPYEVEEARDAHEPLVVELGASWCKPCRFFETHVLPDPRVQGTCDGEGRGADVRTVHGIGQSTAN